MYYISFPSISSFTIQQLLLIYMNSSNGINFIVIASGTTFSPNEIKSRTNLFFFCISYSVFLLILPFLFFQLVNSSKIKQKHSEHHPLNIIHQNVIYQNVTHQKNEMYKKNNKQTWKT
jgi:hypothetical protein